MKELSYIYNIRQATYYIQQGLQPVVTGKGNLGDMYIAFDKHEAAPVFKKWCEQCREYTANNKL